MRPSYQSSSTPRPFALARARARHSVARCREHTSTMANESPRIARAIATLSHANGNGNGNGNAHGNARVTAKAMDDALEVRRDARGGAV